MSKRKEEQDGNGFQHSENHRHQIRKFICAYKPSYSIYFHPDRVLSLQFTEITQKFAWFQIPPKQPLIRIKFHSLTRAEINGRNRRDNKY